MSKNDQIFVIYFAELFTKLSQMSNPENSQFYSRLRLRFIWVPVTVTSGIEESAICNGGCWDNTSFYPPLLHSLVKLHLFIYLFRLRDPVAAEITYCAFNQEMLVDHQVFDNLLASSQQDNTKTT